MAKRLVCCPAIDASSNVGLRYLYLDSLSLQVEDVTDVLAPLNEDLRSVCCLDKLVDYAYGTKALDLKVQDALPFDFKELNSFELFKNTEELRLKTGSEKILHSCLLSYYRREYDGTQQHTFFSEPAYNAIHRDGVEHELTLENRTFIKKEEEEYVPETLDKGKSMAEREAEAAAAQAQAELQEALAEADAKDAEKASRDKKRKQARQRRADEAYREFRNQDDIQSEQYQRLRRYEEEMRANNDYLASEYAAGNYSSLPGYMPSEVFSQAFETVENETLRCSYNPSELFAVASRLDEFGVNYTVIPEQGLDGSVRSCICYTSEQAEPALRAIEFFELEKQLQHDSAISSGTFLSAFQLQAMDFAYVNYVDTSYVSSGAFSGSQMYRILEAGLDGCDMSVLANPNYSPAQMDALNYFMRQGWDVSPISEPGIPMAAIADNIFREELSHGVSEDNKFFNSHVYDEFISYDKRDNDGDYSNSYDSAHRKELYARSEQIAQTSKEGLQDFKDNVHTAYEYSQKEMNYIPVAPGIDNTAPVTTGASTPPATVPPASLETASTKPGISHNISSGVIPVPGVVVQQATNDTHHIVPTKGAQHNAGSLVGKDGCTYFKNNDGTLRDASGRTFQLDKSGQPIPVNTHSSATAYTPTGRVRADGSYESRPNYRRTATPIPGNNRTTDYTTHRNQQNTPQGANPLNVRKRPLDELQVRCSFAERAGARVQRFGSQALHTGGRFISSSGKMLLSNITNSDETGTMSNLYKFSRDTIFTVQLVRDLPRMFAKPGVSYTNGAVQGAKNGLPGLCRPCQNDLPLRSKPWEERIAEFTKAHEKSLKKAFGDKAALNIKQIDKQIGICGAALAAERDKIVPINRQLKAQIKALPKSAVLAAKKELLIGESRKLKQEIKSLSELKKKRALSPDEQRRLDKLLKQKKANEQLIRKKAQELKKHGPVDRKAVGKAKKLLTQKKANELLLAKKGRLVKDLNRLKKQKLDFNKKLKQAQKKLRAAQAAEGRLNSLPGMLVDTFVQGFYQSGDHTLIGLGQATSFTMNFARSPITRLIFSPIRKAIAKKNPRCQAKKKPSSPKQPIKTKPQSQPKNAPKSKIKHPARSTGTKSGLLHKNTRTVGIHGKKEAKMLFGQNQSVKLWIKQTGRKIAEAAKAAAAAIKGLFAGGAAAGAGGAAAGGGAVAGAAAGGPVLIIILAIVTFAVLAGFVSSFVVTDKESDDGRIDLSEYVGYINDNQNDLQLEINGIANSINSETGKTYDNVFYDYIGEHNTKHILAMTYVRFGFDLTNKTAVREYIDQLYQDSNFVDYAESAPYACANGCVERSYFCYEEYDEYATETRKSLYDASKGKGCIPSAAYFCDEQKIIGKHNDGNAMDAPCSCDNYRKETVAVETGDYLYYCPGYPIGSGYGYHSANLVPMDSPCSCPDCYSQPEIVYKTKYYCQGYSGETYNKNGCKRHNNGNPSDTPCSCDDYSTNTEVVTVRTFVCLGYTIASGETVYHNNGEPMNKPCSCPHYATSTERVQKKTYICNGYCPGNHYDYTCTGHTESVCYAEHQDITITITSLGFDDIFYADSSLASSGSFIRGEAYDGTFVISAYCKCHDCCHVTASGKVLCDGKGTPDCQSRIANSKTASGTSPKAKHTLAVDASNPVVPMGTHVWIDGVEYVVEDTGGFGDSGRDFDMYFDSHQQALQWGIRTKKVYKSVEASTDSSTADQYGFTGWTKDNIDLTKGIYDGLTNDDADEIYAGLDGITQISYGGGFINFDFSGLIFEEVDINSLTTLQKKVLSVIESNRVATARGRCQAWVAGVYRYAGAVDDSRCCANHAGEAWGASNNWADIQIGATVYGYSSSLYGHVGIYIGNGMVAHNIGYVKIESLESWVKTYRGVCWGWNGGCNLTGLSQYDCKPAGTFMHGKD